MPSCYHLVASSESPDNIDYDSAGRITSRVLASNVITGSYAYYPWALTNGGRLSSAGYSSSAGALQALSYTYDPVGNINTILDSVNSQTQAFSYDELDRLTSASATGNSNSGGYGETYDFDPNTGNMAMKAGASYTYGDPAHAHAVTNAGNDTYTYDANGNMLTRRVSNKTITFTYDAEGHLMTGTGTGLNASFVYDGDGARVKSTINGVTTTFIGNTYEKTGSTVTKYYFAGGQRVAMRTGSTLYYLLGDHLGSTAITTSATGTKVAELRYKAWGETRYTSGTTPTKYQFTGQYSNVADFGLMYYGARWYDGSLGRFSSADSVVGSGPQGYDRFTYVGNSPVNHTDPTGHCEEADLACRVILSQTLPQVPTTPTPTPSPTPSPTPTPSLTPTPTASPVPTLRPIPVPTPIPANPACATPQPGLTQCEESASAAPSPNYGEIAAGVGLILAVDTLVAAPIIVGFWLAPEIVVPGVVAEMLVTDSWEVIVFGSGILAANAYGVHLIVEGAQGR